MSAPTVDHDQLEPARTARPAPIAPAAVAPRRHRLAAAFATALCAGAALSAAGLAEAGPAHADSFNYQVTNYDNDGTHGVYLRNSGNVNDVNRDSAHYVTYGTTVHLICGLSGSAVGPQNNTAWDYVQVQSGPISGAYGYLSEHWLNTPIGPNQHVSGEPACGGGTSGPSGTAQAAINWANARNGQSVDSGYCLLFVEQAYSAAGVNIGRAGTAAQYWSSNPNGYAEHPGNTSPDVGSLVFWGATSANSAGHVGIYLGNNTVISTSSWPEPTSGTTVHTWSFSGRNAAGYPYLGWMHIA